MRFSEPFFLFQVIDFLFLCVSDGALLYTEPGHNVTLPGFYVSGANNVCWYKQVAGEQPQILSSVYKHLPDSNIFHKHFKDNKRVSVHTGARSYHLNISTVQASERYILF